MYYRKFLSVLTVAGAALVLTTEPSFSADPAKEAKKELRLALKKKAEEEARNAEEAKKKAELLQQPKSTAPVAEAFKPVRVGGVKDTLAVSKFIDTQIAKRLAEENVPASALATDEEFLRRVYIDLSGTIPTIDQATAFLADQSSNKRAKLIDELLASSNFGHHMADVWMNLLIERNSENRRVDFSPVRGWLMEKFNENTPWDKLATEVIAASGDFEKNPAVGFYLSSNTVDKMTDDVSKIFLGVQLQCAQCHDHKFNDWKQKDYWAMAQFFMHVSVTNPNQKSSTTSVTEVTNVRRNKNVNVLPESAMTVQPRFLQGESVAPSASEPHRPLLARWATSATNPFFAKAMTNRVWSLMFGRGIVNPVDDMVGQNLASHPDLLQGLAGDFAANGFDVKHLVRSICNSSTYQRSTLATSGNEKATPDLYARMAVKILTPEQLFDSLAQVSGMLESQKARDKSTKGVQGSARDRFTTFFLAGSEMSNLVEYEAGIPQALKLMNSKQLGNNVQAVRTVVGTARGSEAIERMYLATLSRRPTSDETKRIESYFAKNGATPNEYSDVLWALLNSSEFTLVR
jgi:Protein of unknown function (DUF1549)/Protein of unknown function (DUF1553)